MIFVNINPNFPGVVMVRVKGGGEGGGNLPEKNLEEFCVKL